jgi:hypothetical protein
MEGVDLSLPVPINWLRASFTPSLSQIPTGILLFVVSPLQHFRKNYTCAAVGTGKDSRDIPFMPGPLSFVVPVKSTEEESVQEKTSGMINSILVNLKDLFEREKSARGYEGTFTPESVDAEIIQANPDAITAVKIHDDDSDDLWEIWVYWYQWDGGDWR